MPSHMATKILALRAERGWSQPSLPTVRRIAKALGVPVAELLA